MSGLVNGVLAGTGAFRICNRFDFRNGELQQRDFFEGASQYETNRSLEWFRRRLAFLGEDSRTRASLGEGTER